VFVDFSEDHASEIADSIDSNSTLESQMYFLHSKSAFALPGDAVKQTGSSHVSVIGPDDDFVTATMSVFTLW